MEIRVGAYPAGRPAVHLRRDKWDDYGFKTLYWATLHLRSGQSVDLGAVKILKLGMGEDGGRVDLHGSLQELDSEHCSLGQQPSYYESLQAADDEEPGVATACLTALRDATYSPEIYEEFRDEPGFHISLLREAGARQAFDYGRSIWTQSTRETTEGQLALDYLFPGAAEPYQFHFGQSADLPTRIFAVTGYNGVGKTRLLSNLGMVAAAQGKDRDTSPVVAQHGALVGEAPDITAVVCVSYSAFDDFEVPRIADGASADPDLGRAYHYIGLREPGGDDGELARTLKSIDDIHAEFEAARQQALAKMRGKQLTEIFEPIVREPSFSMGGGLPDLDASPGQWDTAIRSFSTGHKIVLNILVQLCATLERRSLVLLDEPEMHLHPPLVAALLRAIGIALEANDSFAVMATHSPVVAQEIPGTNVMILRRAQGVSTWEDPEIETYGEHIGLLTSRIFNLDNSHSDFRGTLRRLAESMSLEEIEALFGLGLSAQARVIVMSELKQPH